MAENGSIWLVLFNDQALGQTIVSGNKIFLFQKRSLEIEEASGFLKFVLWSMTNHSLACHLIALISLTLRGYIEERKRSWKPINYCATIVLMEKPTNDRRSKIICHKLFNGFQAHLSLSETPNLKYWSEDGKVLFLTWSFQVTSS